MIDFHHVHENEESKIQDQLIYKPDGDIIFQDSDSCSGADIWVVYDNHAEKIKTSISEKFKKIKDLLYYRTFNKELYDHNGELVSETGNNAVFSVKHNGVIKIPNHLFNQYGDKVEISSMEGPISSDCYKIILDKGVSFNSLDTVFSNAENLNTIVLLDNDYTTIYDQLIDLYYWHESHGKIFNTVYNIVTPNLTQEEINKLNDEKAYWAKNLKISKNDNLIYKNNLVVCPGDTYDTILNCYSGSSIKYLDNPCGWTTFPGGSNIRYQNVEILTNTDVPLNLDNAKIDVLQLVAGSETISNFDHTFGFFDPSANYSDIYAVSLTDVNEGPFPSTDTLNKMIKNNDILSYFSVIAQYKTDYPDRLYLIDPLNFFGPKRGSEDKYEPAQNFLRNWYIRQIDYLLADVSESGISELPLYYNKYDSIEGTRFPQTIRIIDMVKNLTSMDTASLQEWIFQLNYNRYNKVILDPGTWSNLTVYNGLPENEFQDAKEVQLICGVENAIIVPNIMLDPETGKELLPVNSLYVHMADFAIRNSVNRHSSIDVLLDYTAAPLTLTDGVHLQLNWTQHINFFGRVTDDYDCHTYNNFPTINIYLMLPADLKDDDFYFHDFDLLSEEEYIERKIPEYIYDNFYLDSLGYEVSEYHWEPTLYIGVYGSNEAKQIAESIKLVFDMHSSSFKPHVWGENGVQKIERDGEYLFEDYFNKPYDYEINYKED